MYIIIIEDDPVQYKFIEETLEQKDFTNLRLERIKFEAEFRNRFDEIAKDRPEILILDVMIRWTDPSPNMEKPPQKIIDDGFYRAGIRCIQMLNDDKRTKNIPIIVYSVLEEDTLKDEIKYFPQAKYLYKDFDARRLINTIQSRIR